MAMSAFGDPLDEEPAQPVQRPAVSAFGDPLDDDAPQSVQGSSALDRLDDVGVALSRGFVGAAEGVVGLADILSGGAAGNALEKYAGWNPERRKAELDQLGTPEYRQAQNAVRGATGFAATLRAIGENPSVIPHAIAESAPSMMLGGVFGRGVGAGAQLLGRSAPVLGAAVGEGTVAAGQAAEQTRQATGTLDAKGTGLAIATGAATGLLGAAGARLGRMFGIADIDAQLAGQNGVDVARGLVARVLGSGGLEAVEEAGQSAQETVLGNIAAGRDPMANVGQSAALGAVTGGVMGGAAGARQPRVGELMDQRAAEAARRNGTFGPVYQQVKQNEAVLQDAQPAATPPTPFAGSTDINPLLDNLGVTGEQRKQTLQLLGPSEAEIEARRRGTVSLEEQRRLAGMIGLEGAKAQVFERKIGEAWNAEQTHAVTDFVSSSLATVLKQHESIITGQANDVQKAQFVADVLGLRQSFGELMGARAEAGRALAAYRRDIRTVQQAQDILEQVGGAQGADAMARAIGQAMRSGGVQNIAKVIGHETMFQKLMGRYWRAALLTSPSTHITNTAGSLAFLANEVLERSVAAGIGTVKRATGMKGQTVWQEPLQLVIGAAKGQLNAWRAANTAWETGESSILGGGIKEPGQSLSLKPETMGGKVDYALTLPYRMLAAQDAYMAQLNFEGELRALAYQRAQSEKRSGQLQGKVADRVEQLLSNPPADLVEASTTHAKTMTFNSPGGPLVNAINSAKRKFPVLELVAPYIRTPTNLAKAAVKRTPLAVFAPSVIEDIKAGGAAQERALARIAVGTSFMVLVGALAQAGRVTGAGPDDPEEKRALLASGWQPWSIRTADGQYVQYNRADPFASLMGLAADLSTTRWKDADAGDLVARVIGSFAEAFVSKTYMQGVSDLLNMMDEPKRNASWWFDRTVSSLAQPFAIVSRAASADDPWQRETDGLGDAIKYRLPGQRRELPQKLDAFGLPVPNPAFVGDSVPELMAGISSPTRVTRDSEDPVRMEARRLAWNPGEPSKYQTIRGERHEYTAEQHYELRVIAGHITYIGMHKLLQAPGWNNLTDLQKKDALDALARQARTAARTAFLPVLVNGDRRAVDKLKARTDAALQQLKPRR